ncbi:hypothetical protein D3C72_1191540 [compost metagenome]
MQRNQPLAVEAGADLARIAQGAVVFMHGQQQGTQAFARALRGGIAHDDEFLPLGALDLQPAIAAPRHIRRRLALGHEAFQAHLAGRRDQVRGRFLERFAKAQAVVLRGIHQLRQQFTAHGQRLFAQVAAADERQVEGVEHDVAGAVIVKGVLQRLEVGHALIVQHHDLAIHPCPFGGQFGKGLDDMRQLGAPVVAVAGVQLDLVVLDAYQQAVAVELQFVQPVVRVWRQAVYQRGELGLE